MAIIFDEYDKYSIEGKIVDINDRSSTLIISVTSPFVNEVKFYCDSYHYDMLPPPKFTYSWISWVQDSTHPDVPEAAAYYNTNDKCFYKKEPGSESEWERADFKDIYEDNPNLLTVKRNVLQEKYQSFLYKYKSILHKGQLCRFSAYVIKRTDGKFHSVRGQEVERHPNDYDYTWIYDPDTFYGEKWDTESIDGLVKEIRPSIECLKQLFKSYKDDDRITESIDGLVQEIRPSRYCVEWLLESYRAEDREAKRKEDQKKRDRRSETIKSTPERVEGFIGKYPRSLWLIITFGMFLVGIGTLIVSILKD